MRRLPPCGLPVRQGGDAPITGQTRRLWALWCSHAGPWRWVGGGVSASSEEVPTLAVGRRRPSALARARRRFKLLPCVEVEDQPLPSLEGSPRRTDLSLHRPWCRESGRPGPRGTSVRDRTWSFVAWRTLAARDGRAEAPRSTGWLGRGTCLITDRAGRSRSC